LARTGKINVRNTIGKFEFTVACKAVENQGKSLVALHVAGTFEKFVQHRTDNVP